MKYNRVLQMERKSGPFEALLLDLDGTLIDSHMVIYRSLDETFREVAGLEYREEWWHERVGKPLDVLFKFAIAEYDLREVSMDDLVDAYRKHQKVHELDVLVYPGVIEALDRIQNLGIPMAIVTTKHTEATVRQMERAGLTKFFATVVTGDQVENVKPHPEPFLTGAHRLGIPHTDCAAVGDTSGDILSAKAAGSYSVAAMWGAAHPEQLINAGPDRTIQTPLDLLSLVRREAA